MSAIFAVAGKLVTLFIYVLVGYVVSKRKMISEGFSAGISRFLLVVTIPCLILSTFETDYTFERLVKAGEVYVISLIIFGASILIGYLTAWILRISEESKSVWIYSVTFTNHAFMGWAVMDAVFGGESIFYATFANLAFSTYAYTYGVWLMRSTGTEAGKKHSMKEYILTPVNAAIVVGLIMFIFQLRFPAPVDNAVQGMSSLTTPMAMLYVGTILTKSSIKDVFSDWRTYACSFVRLVLIPLLVLMIARPLIHDPMIYGVLVIGHAMPVAGFCAIFAGEYGNDVVLASKFIFIRDAAVIFLKNILALQNMLHRRIKTQGCRRNPAAFAIWLYILWDAGRNTRHPMFRMRSYQISILAPSSLTNSARIAVSPGQAGAVTS